MSAPVVGSGGTSRLDLQALLVSNVSLAFRGSYLHVFSSSNSSPEPTCVSTLSEKVTKTEQWQKCLRKFLQVGLTPRAKNRFKKTKRE
jgi:hypothetical protein